MPKAEAAKSKSRSTEKEQRMEFPPKTHLPLLMQDKDTELDVEKKRSRVKVAQDGFTKLGVESRGGLEINIGSSVAVAIGTTPWCYGQETERTLEQVLARTVKDPLQWNPGERSVAPKKLLRRK